LATEEVPKKGIMKKSRKHEDREWAENRTQSTKDSKNSKLSPGGPAGHAEKQHKSQQSWQNIYRSPSAAASQGKEEGCQGQLKLAGEGRGSSSRERRG